MKRCSTSFIIREIQLKTTVRYHLTWGHIMVRMAFIKMSTKHKCRRGCAEKGIFLHCWWECKLIQPLWKTVWRFLNKNRNKTSIRPSNPTPRHRPWGNQNWKRHMYPTVHCSANYNSQNMEATQMSIATWTDEEAVVHIHDGMLLLLLLSHVSRVWLCVTPRRQPTRLLCFWDSPSKNTGVGCHFLLQCMKVKSQSEVAQLCPTLKVSDS